MIHDELTTLGLETIFANVQQDEEYGNGDADAALKMSYQGFLEALAAVKMQLSQLTLENFLTLTF
jgi:hypothetical protein